MSFIARLRAQRRLAQAANRRVTGAPLTPCELGVSSQNGEDGVLAAILGVIGTGTQWFVEFGIGDGRQGNCVARADLYGWRGVFLEADPDAQAGLTVRYAGVRRVRTGCERVDATNVEAVFTHYGVPARFDVLSLDIDGNDLWVWQALDAFRPRVLIAEYNSHLPLERALVMPRDDGHSWDGTDYFGASLGAWCRVGAAKGYTLVHTESTGVNAFFVAEPVPPGLPRSADVPRHPPNLLGRGIRLPRDPRRRPFLDLETGSLVGR